MGCTVVSYGKRGITAMISLSSVLDGNVGSGSGEYDMMWCGEMGLGWSGGRGILVSLFRVCYRRSYFYTIVLYAKAEETLKWFRKLAGKTRCLIVAVHTFPQRCSLSFAAAE